MEKFFKEFLCQLNIAVLGSVTVLFIFTMTTLQYFFPLGTKIPVQILLIALIISYAICICVYASLAARKEVVIKEPIPVLPKVRNICPINRNSVETFIFILERNSIYEAGSYVFIYYEDDNEITILLGTGYVESINDKGSVQVIMTDKSTIPEAIKIIASLGNHCVNAIKVKPYILNYYKGEFFNNE